MNIHGLNHLWLRLALLPYLCSPISKKHFWKISKAEQQRLAIEVLCQNMQEADLQTEITVTY